MKIVGAYHAGMDNEIIDELIQDWHRERPELDALPMAVVGRVLRLATRLEKRVNEALKPFDLALWGFDVLATLRRRGKPYAMTPTELMRSVMLTSGAMTNRVDRLEKLGLVERCPAPTDRRSLQVKLTRKGLLVANRAVEARFEEAEDALSVLGKRDREILAGLLRRVLLGLEDEES